MEKIARRILLSIVLTPVYMYRYLISPVLGPRCRFLPTCSEYAVESVTRYGVLKGLKLTFRRIIKCHPKGKSGYDPVP